MALFDLRTDPGESRDLHADHPRTRELARRLLSGWARVAPGLHLTIAAPGGHPARVEIASPELSPILVRAVAFAGEATWEERLHLDLPAGSTTELILDLPVGEVTATSAGHSMSLGGEHGTFFLGDVRLEWRWKLVDGWRAAARPVDDELLRSQLRALGYVN